MYIKDIMTKDVITVTMDDNVEKCASLLIKHNLSGLPVLDESGKLVGIVTEGDLIRRASRIKGPAVLEVLGGLIYLDSPKKFMDELKNSMGQKAGDVMTKKVVTIDPEQTIEEGATLLVEKKVKRLPVVDKKGELVGIVSRRDIMSYLFPEQK
ncbi:CBS domain-containing protein [Gudongella sp. SC589]|jgi:CBS domain-containing protein|uniref:CBS domain-containing protein n=1 Tax=Gudongella sp. SC589 TaxID=3385990 RepID=UPI0039048A34